MKLPYGGGAGGSESAFIPVELFKGNLWTGGRGL